MPGGAGAVEAAVARGSACAGASGTGALDSARAPAEGGSPPVYRLCDWLDMGRRHMLIVPDPLLIQNLVFLFLLQFQAELYVMLLLFLVHLI